VPGRAARVGWEDPGPCLPLCRAVRLPVPGRAARVGWEDPGPCLPLCRAVRPTRRIGGRVRGWAPRNLARSPRSGALKIFHMFCVSTSCSGVLLRKCDWRTFISVHFFETWVAPGHPWLPPLPPPPLLPAPPALVERILGITRLSGTQCVELMLVCVARVGWEDPEPCPPLWRAVRPARRIGGRPEGGHLRIGRAAPGRAH
jgi:hypothetical protein